MTSDIKGLRRRIADLEQQVHQLQTECGHKEADIKELQQQLAKLREAILVYINNRPAHHSDDHTCELCRAIQFYPGESTHTPKEAPDFDAELRRPDFLTERDVAALQELEKGKPAVHGKVLPSRMPGQEVQTKVDAALSSAERKGEDAEDIADSQREKAAGDGISHDQLLRELEATPDKTPGQVAYEAYMATLSKHPMPWQYVGVDQKPAFEAAARAVSGEVEQLRTRLADAERAIAAKDGALHKSLAAVWDGHYGRGVAVGYAQAVDAVVKSALSPQAGAGWLSPDEAKALRERVDEAERTNSRLIEAGANMANKLAAAQQQVEAARKLIGDWRAVSNVMSEADGDGPYRETYRNCARELEAALAATAPKET